MHRRLTTDQIRRVCEEMLGRTEEVSVRSVMAELRALYGACGRTERVAEVLRDLVKEKALQRQVSETSDVVTLRRELLEQQQRAERAEDRERRHQDYFAARYQEKVEELERRLTTPAPAGISSEKYLRLYQRAVELARRLSQYETVEYVLEPGRE